MRPTRPTRTSTPGRASLPSFWPGCTLMKDAKDRRGTMTLADLATSPDPVFHGLAPDDVPPDIAAAFRWLVHKDELRDQGVPEDQIPDFEDWKAGSNG
jgi:hypothetical protein